jgi:hypothetical protein
MARYLLQPSNFENSGLFFVLRKMFKAVVSRPRRTPDRRSPPPAALGAGLPTPPQPGRRALGAGQDVPPRDLVILTYELEGEPVLLPFVGDPCNWSAPTAVNFDDFIAFPG